MKNFSCILILTLTALAAPATPDKAPDTYVLGPGDALLVQVVGLPEFDTQARRIDRDGSVGLPLIGRVRAEGLTLRQFEDQVTLDLQKQVLHPHVVASLAEARVEPVSVIGAVNNPGTQHMEGQKRLFDVLAAAGGVKTEAGNMVTITREKQEGPLNLPNVSEDPATGRLTAVVSLHELVNLGNPAANILVRPHDEISVSRAQLIYVIGDVKKAGAFTLSEGRSMSALEALALAEGLEPNAAAKRARILRRQGAGREQIPIKLNRILDGKLKDVSLTADDILYVPDNTGRRVTTKTLEAAMQTISGIIIWRGL